jgi:hypothetical protein
MFATGGSPRDGSLRRILVVGYAPEHEHVRADLLVAQIQAVQSCDVADRCGFAVEVGELVCDSDERAGSEGHQAETPASLASRHVDVARGALLVLLVGAHRSHKGQQKTLDAERLIVVFEHRSKAAETISRPLQWSGGNGLACALAEASCIRLEPIPQSHVTPIGRWMPVKSSSGASRLP